MKNDKTLLFVIPQNRSTQDKIIAIVEEALTRGIKCDFLCYGDKSWNYMKQQLPGREGHICRKKVSSILQWFMERSNSGRLLFRAGLWCSALADRSFKGYVGAIAADDSGPVESVVGRRMPLLIFQITIDFFNAERVIGIHRWKKSKEDRTFSENVMFLCDRIFSGTILPRIGGHIAKFKPGRVAIDAVFGPRPVPAVRGMGSSRYHCVAGKSYIDINQTLGISSEKLVATGFLEFDRLLEIAKHNDSEQTKELLKAISASEDKPVISFFSSPQLVLKEQFRSFVDDFKIILKAVNQWLPDYQIIFVHHPKFGDGEEGYRFVEQELSNIKNLTIVRKFDAPDFNARLVVMSGMVISPGTLGMSGAALRKPVLSYSFGTEQWDEINNSLRLSVHVRNQGELDEALQRFQEKGLFEGLVDKQTEASERYFHATGKAASEALDLLLLSKN